MYRNVLVGTGRGSYGVFKANIFMIDIYQHSINQLIEKMKNKKFNYEIIVENGPFRTIESISFIANISPFEMFDEKYNLKFYLSKNGRLEKITLYSFDDDKYFESRFNYQKIDKLINMIDSE